MDVRTITIISGYGRSGVREPLREVIVEMGKVASIVGPTGSGKTALINDIELFANENTPSRRKVLINGETLPDEVAADPSRNPIAIITQHTNFFSDLSVREFLAIHAGIRRRSGSVSSVIDETLEFANQLTGEPIMVERAMTELSGGQARALMITDAVVIGNSPIILLDEIENAGIDKIRAVELLKHYRKIFVFVTHDLRIALLSDFRIIMENGAMQRLVVTDEEERRVADEITRLDDLMLDMRNTIRHGGHLSEEMLRKPLESLSNEVTHAGHGLHPLRTLFKRFFRHSCGCPFRPDFKPIDTSLLQPDISLLPLLQGEGRGEDGVHQPSVMPSKSFP